MDFEFRFSDNFDDPNEETLDEEWMWVCELGDQANSYADHAAILSKADWDEFADICAERNAYYHQLMQEVEAFHLSGPLTFDK